MRGNVLRIMTILMQIYIETFNQTITLEQQSHQSPNNEETLGEKRRLQTFPITGELHTLNDTSIYISGFSSLTIMNQPSRIINSMSIVISNYLIISHLKTNKIYIGLYDLNSLASGEIANTKPAQSSFSDSMSNPELYSYSLMVSYIGNNEFLYHCSNKILQAKGVFFNVLYSKFTMFDSTNANFGVSSYAAYSERLLFRTDRYSFSNLADIETFDTNMIHSTVNFQGNPAVVMISLTTYKVLNVTSAVSSYTYYEINFSEVPLNTAILSQLNNNIIYHRYTYFLPTEVNPQPDSIMNKRKFDLIFDSKVFSYSANKVLYVYIPFSQDSIAISYWDYGRPDISPPLSGTLKINIPDSCILSAQIDYTMVQNTGYITLIAFRQSISIYSNTSWYPSYFTTIYRIPVSNPLSYVSKDLQGFSQDNDTSVVFLRVIGSWVFYCTNSPNECWSWLANTNDIMNLSNGNHLIKINTQSIASPGTSAGWWVTDLMFYEKPLYGETVPFIFYYESIQGNPKINFNAAALKMVTGTGTNLDNVCLTLTNYQPDNNSVFFCTLRCYLNQYYNSFSSSECFGCDSLTPFAQNNSCVSDCGSAHPIIIGYCDDTVLLDTKVNAIKSMEPILPSLSCADTQTVLNYSCTFCNTVNGLLQFDRCESICRPGYQSCDNLTCGTLTCNNNMNNNTNTNTNTTICQDGQLLENGVCVYSCQIHGNTPDMNGLNCVNCPDNGYELDFTNCVLPQNCPSNYTLQKNQNNNNANYCLLCSGVVENGVCQSQCLVHGNVPDPTGKYCMVCLNKGYEVLNRQCVSNARDCPKNSIPSTNFSNKNANYCFICANKFIELGKCVDACQVTGYIADNNFICGPCPDPNQYYDLTLKTCNYCQTTNKLAYTTDQSTNARYCFECDSNLLVENGKCVMSCTVPNILDATKSFCFQCSDPLPLIDSSGAKCVSSCQQNEIIDITIGNGQCVVSAYLQCLSTSNTQLTPTNNCCPNYSFYDVLSHQCIICNLNTSNIYDYSNIDCLRKSIISIFDTFSTYNEPLDTAEITEIYQIANLIRDLQDVYDDSILSPLVIIAMKQLSIIDSWPKSTNKNLLALFDSALLVKHVGDITQSSKIDLYYFEERLSNLTLNLLASGNIADIYNQNSTFYYGNSFSISLNEITNANNHLDSNIDSACLNTLLENGLLQTNDKIYPIKINYNYPQDFNSSSSQSTPYPKNNINLVKSFYFYTNGKPVNSSLCNTVEVKIQLNTSSPEYTEYLKIKNQTGQDIFNKSSEFFNDICFSFTLDNETDITVESRRQKYNYTEEVCFGNCTYNGFINGSISCICEDSDNVLHSISSYFTESIYDNLALNNIGLAKCAEKAFDGKTILHNYAFWFYLVLTLLNLSIIIAVKIYYSYGAILVNLAEVIYNDGKFGVKPTESGSSKEPNLETPKAANQRIQKKQRTFSMDNNNGSFEVQNIDKKNKEMNSNAEMSIIYSGYLNTQEDPQKLIIENNNNNNNNNNKIRNNSINIKSDILSLQENISGKVCLTNNQKPDSIFIENTHLDLGEFPNSQEKNIGEVQKNSNNSNNYLNNTNNINLKPITNILLKLNNNIKNEIIYNNKTECLEPKINFLGINQFSIFPKVVGQMMNVQPKKKTIINSTRPTKNQQIGLGNIEEINLESKSKENNNSIGNTNLSTHQGNLNILNSLPSNRLKKDSEEEKINKHVKFQLNNNFIDDSSRVNTFVQLKLHNTKRESRMEFINNTNNNNDNTINNNNDNNMILGEGFVENIEHHNDCNILHSGGKNPLANSIETKESVRNNNKGTETENNEYSPTSTTSTRGLDQKSPFMAYIEDGNNEEKYKTLKHSDINSEEDFEELPITIQVKIDQRGFWRYLWETLKREHNELNLIFYKSILSPLWIRCTQVFFGYSLDFCLNAIFYSSNIINAQAEVKAQEGANAIGFWYIVTNQFWNSFWPVIISLIITSIINLIIKVPRKFRNELNFYICTKDKEHIKLG